MRRLMAVAAACGLAVTTARAQVVRPVLQFPNEIASNVTIDDAGTVVYAASSTNQFGVNPDYRKQIVRWDPATGTGTPMTDYEEGVESVSVSDDGTWLAFVTAADLLGTNHDESTELYVMHPDGTGLAQLTSSSFSPFDARRGIRAAVISGSGNRIAFVGQVDPLGTNPTYLMGLFVIDRDGTNLRQLRTAVRFTSEQPTGPYGNVHYPSFDISDDGSKLVYATGAPGDFGGINANGTGNHTFTSTTNAGGIMISGNGTKVAYTAGSSTNYVVRVRTFDGNPGTIVTLGSGERPSLNDDATLVTFYRYADINGNPAGIYRIASTGGTATLIAPNMRPVCLAGGGNRIIGSNGELIAMDDAGGHQEQLTTTVFGYGSFVDELAMSSDGHAMHFDARIDPLGTNPVHEVEYFSYGLDTGQFVQLTDASFPITDYIRTDVADDGSVVSAINGFLGGNCPPRELYRNIPVFTQLTDCPLTSDGPELRRDGQVVAYIGETVDFQLELFSVNADGTGRTQLTPPGVQNDFVFYGLGVAGTGPTTWIAFNDRHDLFRVKADGSSFQQITTGGGSDELNPSISADGSVIAWMSSDDHGQNPDHSTEAFVFEDATQTIRQITSNHEVWTPSVTPDGQWVFVDATRGAGRFHVESGTYDYVGGSHRALSVRDGALPDATGHRWLIRELHDTTDRVLLADLDVVPAFVVGKPSPTVLSWDESPFSLRYDVVRGSIANLSIAGSTVNLGPVSCLEDDSPDNHTKGHGDPTNPAPGQAFFYLYRGSVGFDAAAGSYGQGTGGKERVAGAGQCNP